MATSTCSIADCQSPVLARTWCRKHYRRWQRLGDPGAVTRAEALASRDRAGERQCNRCDAWKPLEDYFVKSGRGTRMRHCIPCHRALNASIYYRDHAQNREKRNAYRDALPVDVLRARRRVDASARRARMVGAETDGIVSIEALRGRDGDNCAYCDERLAVPAMTLDHVLPLSRGGSHTMDNAVLACRPCNSQKHARTPEEWRAGMRIRVSARI